MGGAGISAPCRVLVTGSQVILTLPLPISVATILVGRAGRSTPAKPKYSVGEPSPLSLKAMKVYEYSPSAPGASVYSRAAPGAGFSKLLTSAPSRLMVTFVRLSRVLLSYVLLGALNLNVIFGAPVASGVITRLVIAAGVPGPPMRSRRILATWKSERALPASAKSRMPI